MEDKEILTEALKIIDDYQIESEMKLQQASTEAFSELLEAAFKLKAYNGALANLNNQPDYLKQNSYVTKKIEQIFDELFKLLPEVSENEIENKHKNKTR